MNNVTNSQPKFAKSITASSNVAKHIVDVFHDKFAAWLKARKQRHADRAAIKALLSLKHTQLNDIGLTRADVVWASQLPKDQNASKELEKITRKEGK